MSDAPPPGVPADVLERLHRVAPGIRALAAFREGELLAASCEGEWSRGWAGLWERVDGERDREGTARELHIGVDEGEVFAVREDGLGALAVTDRLVLASLVLWDLRAVLRRLREAEAG